MCLADMCDITRSVNNIVLKGPFWAILYRNNNGRIFHLKWFNVTLTVRVYPLGQYRHWLARLEITLISDDITQKYPYIVQYRPKFGPFKSHDNG